MGLKKQIQKTESRKEGISSWSILKQLLNEFSLELSKEGMKYPELFEEIQDNEKMRDEITHNWVILEATKRGILDKLPRHWREKELKPSKKCLEGWDGTW